VTGPDPAARIAVSAVFAANGALVASWIVRIPDIQAGLGLRESTLGLVLAGLAVGVLTALPLAGAAVARIGSRRVTLLGMLIGAVALPLTGLAGGPLALAACLLALGVGAATMDVGMNAQGIGVETGYGRSILVGMHASWSLGALGGAGVGALGISLGWPVAIHLSTVAGAVALGTLVSVRWLRVPDRAPGGRRGPRLALPRGVLVPIALVALGASLGESTASDWSGIMLRDVVGVSPGRAGWGFVTFTAAMTVARLLGDRVTDRLGPRRTVVWGGRLAAAGFALLAVVPTVPTALLGFAAAGAGVAAVTPLAFAAAGRTAGSAGAGVAAVAFVGYLGFLAGPPLVGVLAERVDLRLAFALVAALILALTARPRGFEAGPDGAAVDATS
jgi:MFS family permease